MASTELIIVGLVLNIAGVILISVSLYKIMLWLSTWLGRLVADEWQEIINKAKNKVRITVGIGIFLLILGFVLQIIGNIIQ